MKEYILDKYKSELDNFINVAAMMKPCEFCSRLKKLGRGRRIEEPDTGFIYESSCEAFPNGIPAEIMIGKFNHTNPHAGDHGLQFKNEEILDLDGKKYSIGWNGAPEEIK